MKKLILFRHSKAESSDLPKPDRDRELAERGSADARAMGHLLVGRALLPDIVLASDSARTRQTSALVCEALPSQPEMVFLPELYSASGGDILDVVATHAEGYGTILVVGHNPGMEEAVWQLARKSVRLRTSTAAVFENDGDGSESAPVQRMRLADVFGPTGESQRKK